MVPSSSHPTASLGCCAISPSLVVVSAPSLLSLVSPCPSFPRRFSPPRHFPLLRVVLLPLLLVVAIASALLLLLLVAVLPSFLLILVSPSCSGRTLLRWVLLFVVGSHSSSLGFTLRRWGFYPSSLGSAVAAAVFVVVVVSSSCCCVRCRCRQQQELLCSSVSSSSAAAAFVVAVAAAAFVAVVAAGVVFVVVPWCWGEG